MPANKPEPKKPTTQSYGKKPSDQGQAARSARNKALRIKRQGIRGPAPISLTIGEPHPRHAARKQRREAAASQHAARVAKAKLRDATIQASIPQ